MLEVSKHFRLSDTVVSGGAEPRFDRMMGSVALDQTEACSTILAD